MILGVAGKPVVHSLSPELHRAGLLSNKIDGCSLRLIVDDAKEIISVARKIGMKGCNVTAPFKEQLCQFVDVLSTQAKELAAVNTLLFEDQEVSGFNTDIYGVAVSIQRLLQKTSEPDAISPKVVVLGAGGAAKAVCYVLKDLKLNFVILNRTLDKAKQLAEQFCCESVSFSDSAHEKYISQADLLINCLSTQNAPFDLSLLNSRQRLLDSHYKSQSDIAKKITELGGVVKDGFDWLLYQSQRSQEIFMQKAPSDESLRTALQQGRRIDNLKSIALIGLMGAGKTRSGLMLAKKLGINFVDLDSLIESKAGKKISRIFTELGEEKFRDIESETLSDLLENSEPQVISCGGGVILRHINVERLQSKTKIIWLWGSPEILDKRLEGSQDRPLLSPEYNIKDRISDLLKKRKKLYANSADLVLDTDYRSAEQVSLRIYDEIS